MGPKFDPTAVYTVFIRCRGGEIPSTTVLGPKIGSFGLQPKLIAEQISNLSKDYKNIRVTIKMTIQNRKAEMMVVPTASSLIIKALNEPQRDRKKVKN
ncbi:hypothetical protein GJ496_008131, partial [Pomphorhynchus laevis]